MDRFANRHPASQVTIYRGHIWSNGFRASVLQVAVTRLSRRYIHRPKATTCFGNETRRNPESLGVSRIKVDVSGFDTFGGIGSLTVQLESPSQEAEGRKRREDSP